MRTRKERAAARALPATIAEPHGAPSLKYYMAARTHWPQAEAELDEARAEVERLREAHNLRHTCVVCSAELLPDEEPPHCMDCVVDEDSEQRWEAQIERP